MKKLSILFVYYNTPEEIAVAMNSLSGQLAGVEIIIVDNNSPRPIPESIETNTKIKIIYNKVNKGFGRALNQASRIATGKYLLFLNPDTGVPEDFVKKILTKMKSDKKIGLLGVKYINENGKNITSVGGFPTFINILFSFSFLSRLFPKNEHKENYWMTKFNYAKESQVPVVGGACMVVRADVLRQIKGFDPQFFMYFEEADLSERIRLAGYKVVYYPEVTITHLVGRSNNDKEWIRKKFEESRFKIIKKYNGILPALIVEFIVRYLTLPNLLLILILSVSLFLNLYKIQSLMMFYGDFGRDYLAARDMLLTAQIPLRGIPSSVVWLHQGPLSIYLIGLSFLVSGFNPISPAVFYALLGVASTFLVFILGKEYFNRQAGLIAATFYATSPLIVINARMPYHTAPIPFFTLVMFLVLKKVLMGNKRLLPVLFFVSGLLFLLELSNSVLLVLLVITFIIYKIKFTKYDLLKSIAGFALGISPFIIYDLRNNYIQTGGFLLWVLNRIRLFFGFRSDEATSSNISSAANIVWEEINRLIFPHSSLIVSIIILTSLFIITIKFRDLLISNSKTIVVLLWLTIPIIGFLIHTKPGVAYTPVLFPVIVIILSIAFYSLIKINKIFLLLFFTLVCLNFVTLLTNNYYLTSAHTTIRPILFNYSYGLDLALRQQVADMIIKDAKNKEFSLYGGGYLGEVITGIDNYKYLVWYRGGKISELGKLQYRIYENKNEIKNKSKIIFQSKYIAVTKNE